MFLMESKWLYFICNSYVSFNLLNASTKKTQTIAQSSRLHSINYFESKWNWFAINLSHGRQYILVMGYI